MEKVQEFLKERIRSLDEETLETFRHEKINGSALLDLTNEDLREILNEWESEKL